MRDLRVELKNGDFKIISRIKKSLLKNFKVTSCKQIDSAVWLSLYLFVSGEIEEARDLLESFVYDVKYSADRLDLWCSNGNGVLLLAYIYGRENNKRKESELVNIIINEDILTNRTTRGNLLREEFEYHVKEMEWYPNETHKYRCGILGERFFAFLYFLELLPTYIHELNDQEVKLINGNIDDIATRLASEIKYS